MAKRGRSIKSSNACLNYVDGKLIIQELDKEYTVVNEIPFEEFIDGFIGEKGVSVNITYSEEI